MPDTFLIPQVYVLSRDFKAKRRDHTYCQTPPFFDAWSWSHIEGVYRPRGQSTSEALHIHLRFHVEICSAKIGIGGSNYHSLAMFLCARYAICLSGRTLYATARKS